MLSYGSFLGWLSPALSILSSNSTPLSSGPLTNEEISWLGSIGPIGGLIGSLSFGYFASLLGSKRGVLIIAAPIMLFWLLILFGNMFYHILIAEFICGWAGGGTQSTITLFISEIANDE